MLKNSQYLYGPTDRYVPAKINAGQYLLEKIWEFKDVVALINGATDEKLTYGEIAQEAMNLAVSLVRLGVRRGDVVAISSENRQEFWATVLATACAGAVITTINFTYTLHELQHIMGISKPKVIFCSPLAYKAHAKNFRSFGFVKKIIMYGNERPHNTILYNDLAKANNGNSGYPDKIAEDVRFEDFQAVEVEGQNDVAMILYSSGTTGLPKGVMLTHLNVLTACTSQVDSLSLTALTITPWCHTMGLMSMILGFAKGKTVVFLQKFEVEQYLQTIEKYKISLLAVVPPILVALSKMQSKHDVSSVLVVMCGAAPLHKDTVSAVHQRFPNAQAVLQGYGMTESTLVVTMNMNPEKEGSVGLVNSNTVIKIVDTETRRVLGANQKGEICIKGEMVMKGYIGKSKRDDFDEEGFFKSGDIGYYDEEQYVYIVDRIKELIKYKGHQVAPAELEAMLLKHDGIRDAGVVGIPHPSAGEVPLAFVVTQPGVRLTEDEVQRFVADRLSNPKHLRGGVRFIEAIPKTPTGKILRKELRKMAKNNKSKL